MAEQPVATRHRWLESTNPKGFGLTIRSIGTIVTLSRFARWRIFKWHPKYAWMMMYTSF